MCLHVSLVMLEKERQPSSCPLLFHCCQCPPPFACAFACESGYTEGEGYANCVCIPSSSLAVCPLPAHASTLPLSFHVGSHTTPLCANREHKAAHIRYTPPFQPLPPHSLTQTGSKSRMPPLLALRPLFMPKWCCTVAN